MIDRAAVEAIESSDTDALLRIIDALCAAGAWDELVDLRHRCTEAVGRGKQVWGVEEHIRYRLALESPPPIAGAIVSEGRSRVALGPIPEVAASTRTWLELEPFLVAGPDRDTVAAERVVRGESVAISIPDLPASLQVWEPRYPLATYLKDKVEAPAPAVPRAEVALLPGEFSHVDDPDSVAALVDLVQPWTDESNGRSQAVCVEGDHLAAISALGLTSARVVELSPAEGLSWMAWAAASGGAHGRRRGAAAGRYMAWWVVASLSDLDWPVVSEEIGPAAEALSWHWFDDGSPNTGWFLRLAVASPELGLAWALSASDQV